VPRRRIPKGRHLNSSLSAELGQEVVQFESLPLAAGDHLTLSFEETNSDWRQGVWLGTEGELRILNQRDDQFVLWTDSVPPDVEIVCERTDGELRFYNVWDSGRGHGRESQSATSGMLVEELPDGGLRYRCNDIGLNPRFEELAFVVRRKTV